MVREVAESCVDTMLMEMVAMYSGRFYANKPELAARRIEAIGYQVGHELSQSLRMSLDTLWKDQGSVIISRQSSLSAESSGLRSLKKQMIDNLKTHHRSSEMETEDPSTPGESRAAQAGSMYLYFPCGIIRGALSNLGIPSSLPTCSFVVRVKG